MSKNKQRIAFCFSGQARTLDQTYLFFLNNLFDAAKEQGFDYDVFCAVEDDEDVDKVKLLNPTKVEKIKSSDVEKIIEEKYGDFKWLYDSYYVLYNNSNNQLKKSMTNYLQQYYKVKKSIEIKKKYEILKSFKYDIIVRLRFDIIYHNKWNFNQIYKNIQGQKILCCKSTNRKFTLCPIGDFFFIGNSEVMDILGVHFDDFKYSFSGHEIKKYYMPIHYVTRFFDKINSFCHNSLITNYLIRFIGIINTKLFFHCYCAEMIIFDYLQYCNIYIGTAGFEYSLIRKNGMTYKCFPNCDIYEIM